ncbi:MAG: hypothetical protein ACLQVF_06130 [Isosphaeraceae bacterium]
MRTDISRGSGGTIASHFSTRLHPEQIQRIIEKRLPESLRHRVKIWL